MKVKSIIAAAVACVLAMGISGCGNENSAEDDDRLKGTIVITGSTSVEDILTDIMD